MRRVSDILREAREEKKLDFERVFRDTKIKKEFIRAIEEGSFTSLPSESYALGFVKTYAKYLGVNDHSIVPLFRREYKAKHISIVPEFRKSQAKFNRRFLFNSRGFLLLSVILIMLTYIFIQYSSLVFAPKLEILRPKNGQEVSGNVVEVEGKTDPYASVFIDGDEVYIDLSGVFKKSIFAFTGDKSIKIVAKNRFGRESNKEIRVKVK